MLLVSLKPIWKFTANLGQGKPQCPGLLPKVGRAGAHSVTASVWEPAYSLRGWSVPIPSLFASLWFTSFTSVCFLQLPHFALTVWFSKNKEETGKEICVQDGSGEMCLDVRVFGTKWWLPGGQPVSAQLGKKRTNGKTRWHWWDTYRDGVERGDRIGTKSPGVGTSLWASVPQRRLLCICL